MTVKVGKNFCIAPFTQITYSPEGRYSPCAEIGGRPWQNKTGIINCWSSDEFESLRNSFRNNEQDKICNRCWGQESTGNNSLRKRLFFYKHLKENIVDTINGNYQKGPKQINLMIGNLCNLRCRICQAGLSVTYNKEGEYYEKKNGLKNTRYTYPIKEIISFSDQQIEEIYSLTEQCIRIEFYGGEPLYDKSTLKLLELLIDSGRSKNITLFYNTNGITIPSEKQIKLWNEFKQVEFNLSLDATHEKFTYIRHPGQWSDVLKTVEKLKTLLTVPTQLQVICTLSIFNVYYLDEILDEFKTMDLPWFINTLHDPDYYDVRILPKKVKFEIIDKLSKSTHDLEFVINLLKEEIPDQMETFWFWTKEKDEYRKENFAETFPEYYNLLNK